MVRVAVRVTVRVVSSRTEIVRITGGQADERWRLVQSAAQCLLVARWSLGVQTSNLVPSSATSSAGQVARVDAALAGRVPHVQEERSVHIVCSCASIQQLLAILVLEHEPTDAQHHTATAQHQTEQSEAEQFAGLLAVVVDTYVRAYR